ncbi:MAG: lipopolysaccharide biosynthesis protein [Pedobacter sp.]|nr:MAG: lipopolysaccharide biosynthesis protein [Pedobacter sp.]
MGLKQIAVAGILWSLWQQLSGKIISFGISIFLARLLDPSEFGLIAMLSILIAISNLLLDGGLTSSLIRTQNPTQIDLSTIFFFNLVGSVIIYFLIYVLSPVIANFYHQPMLKQIARIYSLILILNAFFGVQSTLLIKEMKFKKQTNIQIPSIIAGGILGIFMAKLGFGIWSLVAMALCTSLLSTIIHWLSSGWRPSLVFSYTCFKKHFSFGYKMTISGLVDSLYQNLYLILIGRYFSVSELGFYARADAMAQLPISNISSAVSKVTYPLFSGITEDLDKLKQVYKRMMQQVIFWNAPLLILLIVIAEPLFTILLTKKWENSIPIFRLLCLGGIMYPLHAYNLNILKVLGKGSLFLRLEIIKKTLSIIGIFLAISYGIYGLLYFQLFFSFTAYYINSIFSGRLINYPAKEQLEDISPMLLFAGIIGVFCFYLDRYLINIYDLPYLRICLLSTCYIGLYGITAIIIKAPALTDFNQLILKR